MSALPKERPHEEITEPLADRELVNRCRSGDTRAFTELVKRYQKLACAVALSAVGDVATAEDVAQEALVTAWTTLDKLDDPVKFRSWLAGIARNTARSWRRHRSRHAPRADHGLEVIDGMADAGPSPLERAVSRQNLHITKQALEQLPLRYREALILYYALGESYTEVANSLQISEATARQRLSRARKKLSGEVSAFHDAALACGKRAGVAAAVLLLIKSRTAMAAVAASKVSLGAGGVSSKGIVALGVAGIGAAFVCIAALVVMLNNKDEPPEEPSPAVRRQPVHQRAVQQPPAAPPSTAPVAPGSNGSPSAVGGADETVRGEVVVGKGKVKDPKTRIWERGQRTRLVYDNHRSAQPSSRDSAVERARKRGKVVKHGPAVLAPADAGPRPLMRPTLDMQAVEREMHGR
ncbi:MAG: sigma-70 family RNA polymerase sigma factor [Deltaproteobacteria bacterium]|nr:sigma-70 family RNA polymerase sigma factor [Deltaproteobacteria bacterium]